MIKQAYIVFEDHLKEGRGGGGFYYISFLPNQGDEFDIGNKVKYFVSKIVHKVYSVDSNDKPKDSEIFIYIKEKHE